MDAAQQRHSKCFERDVSGTGAEQRAAFQYLGLSAGNRTMQRRRSKTVSLVLEPKWRAEMIIICIGSLGPYLSSGPLDGRAFDEGDENL